jgi:hypothetical protein
MNRGCFASIQKSGKDIVAHTGLSPPVDTRYRGHIQPRTENENAPPNLSHIQNAALLVGRGATVEADKYGSANPLVT